MQTFVNIPDRVVGAPPDLSILLPAFPARATELLSGREAIDRPDPERPCFEVTLEEREHSQTSSSVRLAAGRTNTRES